MLIKCILIYPQNLGPLLYYFHTTYRLPFWPQFSPPCNVLDNKFKISPFTFYPSKAHNRIELQLYTDRHTDRNNCICRLPPDPIYPIPPKQCKCD